MKYKDYLECIPRVVEQIRLEYQISSEEPVRDDIFGILEKSCTVIYYPIDDKGNYGFHTKRFVKDRLEDFVFINTAASLSDQVFTAAHEYGHIVDIKNRIENMTGTSGKLTNKESEDLINRFAAELLMPKKIFREKFLFFIKNLGLNLKSIFMKDFIHVIILLMNEFMVPYESVRRRMIETDMIDERTGDYLTKQEKLVKRMVKEYSKDFNSSLDNPTNKKTIPGFRTMLEKLELSGKGNPILIKKARKDFDIEQPGTEEETGEVLNITSGD